MKIAGTGHRPAKLGGYGEEVFTKLVLLARRALEKYQPTEIISGMALGWDQALAQAALDLKIPYTAAVPFKDQAKRWPQTAQMKYQQLLQNSKAIIYVRSNWSPEAFALRNEWMVNQLTDRKDRLLALWDGQPGGGTSQCIEYALAQKKQIINLWQVWESLQSPAALAA
jgi:uncharacterized phage-like protein YoqJ